MVGWGRKPCTSRNTDPAIRTRDTGKILMFWEHHLGLLSMASRLRAPTPLMLQVWKTEKFRGGPQLVPVRHTHAMETFHFPLLTPALSLLKWKMEISSNNSSFSMLLLGVPVWLAIMCAPSWPGAGVSRISNDYLLVLILFVRDLQRFANSASPASPLPFQTAEGG